MPGTTARVQTNVLVRFASTTACQSSSETSSSGRPTCPTTPPALLTRMSTGPIRPRSAATCALSVTSTVSLSTPWTVAPCRSSARAIAEPIPCAVPVTSAVLPGRSGTRPAVLDQLAHFLDARLPHAQHVLVGTLVEAAERAVAEQLPHLGRIGVAHRAYVGHRLSLLRLCDAGEARPREVLEPRGVPGVAADRLHDLPRARAVAPVVPDDLGIRTLGVPRRGRVAAGLVPPVSVDEQEAAEALAVQRLEQLADDGLVRLDAECRAAGVGGEVRRDPVGERRHHRHAQRLGSLDRDALGEDHVHGEREVAVLLDRAERQDDPIVSAQVLLELQPVAVLQPQVATSAWTRA